MSRYIIITGAAGNLGRKVTDAFIGDGYHVHALVSERFRSGTLPEDHCSVYPEDLLQETRTREIIGKIAREAGRIEGAVMIAGGFRTGPPPASRTS